MANKKFSEFELKTTTSNVSHIVGYNGAENVRITPANFLDTTGGPYLPLAGGTMTGALVVDAQGTFNDILTAGLGLAITGGAVGSAKLVLASNNAVYLRGSSAGLILQNSDGTNSLTVDTNSVFSGSLGLAGVTPSEKLDTPNMVIGGPTITGNTRASALYVDNLGGNSRFFSCGADASSNGSYSFRTGTSAALGTTLLTVTPTESTFAGNIFQTGTNVIKNITGNLFLDSATGYNLMFRPGGNEAMRLDAAGNLGIGLTNQTIKLSVLATTTAIASFDTTETTGGYTAYYNSGSVKGFVGYGATLFNSPSLDNNNFGLRSQGGMPFAIGGETVMYISSAKNVGIGTSNPSLKLHTVGVAGFPQSSGATQVGAMRLQTGASTVSMDMGVNSGNGSWIQTNNANDLSLTYPLSLNPNGGNVGIGTTTPTIGRLEIGGTSPTLAINSSSNTEPTLFLLRNGGLNGIALLKVLDGGDLKFDTGANGAAQSEKMRLDASGKLLVGTQSGNTFDMAVIKGTNTVANDFTLTGANTSQVRINFGDTDSSQQGEIGYDNSTDSMRIVTAGAERMRLDANGNLGLGTSPTNYSGYTTLTLGNDSGTGSIFDLEYQTTRTLSIYADSIGGHLNVFPAKPLIFYTTASEKMRLDASGNLLIGTTSTTVGGIGPHKVIIDATSQNLGIITASGNHQCVRFANGTTAVGSINLTTTSTSYGTSSDYRLKEDLQDFKGLDLVSKISVYDYKWKSSNDRSYGVMAHQLQEVLPQAVTGDKDAKEMQSVDYSKIVPLLVKSIQELKAEIELLKNK